jgi:hypothetical protein
MKRIDILLKFAFLIAILLCGLIVLDYLPLHDINNDYVSAPILAELNIELSAGLPSWTNTELEWNIVTINYLLKIIFALTNIGLIFMLNSLIRKSNSQEPGH